MVVIVIAACIFVSVFILFTIFQLADRGLYSPDINKAGRKLSLISAIAWLPLGVILVYLIASRLSSLLGL